MNGRTLRLAFTITLAVTMLRFAGELAGFDRRLFGSDAGGGLALVGIGWLVPVFGGWFAVLLLRQGEAPRRRAAFWLLGGCATAVAGMFLAQRGIGPTPLGMAVGCAGCLAGGAVAFHSWPHLGRWLLLYGLSARLPVIALTGVAIAEELGTHYEKLAPGAPALPPLGRFLVLALAQLAFWLPITVMGGSAGGLLAAAIARGRRRRLRAAA